MNPMNEAVTYASAYVDPGSEMVNLALARRDDHNVEAADGVECYTRRMAWRQTYDGPEPDSIRDPGPEPTPLLVALTHDEARAIYMALHNVVGGVA